MNIQHININGQTIRVGVRTGLPDTTPLMIFNGIGSGLELVLPIVDAMHPDLEVIAFDVPGVGGSSMPSLTYTFSGLAKTVTQILDYLEHEQVNIIGLSWVDSSRNNLLLIIHEGVGSLYSRPPPVD